MRAQIEPRGGEACIAHSAAGEEWRALRMGLVGAGGYGSRHLQALEANDAIRLVAVADPCRNPVLEERLAKHGVHWHDAAESMFESEDLDAISVAAPIPRHFDIARRALRKRLPLYLEKPPVPLVRQLDELIALDPDRNAVVGFQLIHSQPIRRLKQLMGDGALGEILSIRGGASAPRLQSYYERAPWAGKMTLNGEPVFDGPMTNALAHILQNILFLGGAGRPALPIEVRGELYRCASIESYDTACVSGVLDSGIEFAFAGTHASDEVIPHTLEVTGTRHSARLAGARLTSTAKFAPSGEEDKADPLDVALAGFADYVTTGDASRIVTLEDTRGYVLTTNGALLSSREIHTIPPSESRRYWYGGGQGTHMPQLSALIQRCISTGALFSDFGPAWAVRSELVPAAEMRSLCLDDLLRGRLSESGAAS